MAATDTTQKPNVILIGPRACGKSLVAQHLRELLPGWFYVDLDHEYEGLAGSVLRRGSEDYYRKCRGILVKNLATRKGIFALGGGTLINTHKPIGDFELLQVCRERGHLVLLLPTPWDATNKLVLFNREKRRSYGQSHRLREGLKGITDRHYDERIQFFRNNADLVVCSMDPKASAKRIAKRLNLHDT